MLVGLIAFLAMVGVAQAAKTYNDPWLEGDLQQIRVPEALDILARTPQHVIVGDVDSGARLNDPDLAPHLMRMTMPYTCASEYPEHGGGPDYTADPANADFGCDFVGEGIESPQATTIPDGEPSDPYGHGTGTAEIIAGVANNGIEGAGVAPNARVLPVRACYGGNPDCYGEPALAGFTYAVAMGATVINASWPPENDFSSAFRAFIHDNPNVLFDFAIGGTDQNDDPYTLCTEKTTYPNVICVGLAEPNDAAGTTNAQLSTDVSAPGYAGVPSASGARAEFGYTSGATAHVTGAAALLRGLAPKLSASAIREVLVTSSRPVAGYATANKAGGIIDVETAVRAVQSMEGLVTPAPGQGASVDSPDPFAGEVTGGTTTTTSPSSPSTPATPAAPAPVKSSGGKSTTDLAISIEKLPHRVADGATLKLHLDVTGGTGTVTATLVDHKKTLAKATKRQASGDLTVKLRVPRGAKRGAAKLTVGIAGAKPIVETITVTKPR